MMCLMVWTCPLADVPAAAWGIIGAVAGGAAGAVLSWLLPFMARRIGDVTVKECTCVIVTTGKDADGKTVQGEGTPFAEATQAAFKGQIVFENDKDMPVAVYRPHLALLAEDGQILLSKPLQRFTQGDSTEGLLMVRIAPHWPERERWTVPLGDDDLHKARMAMTAELQMRVARSSRLLTHKLGPIRDRVQGSGSHGRLAQDTE